jgi:hypothetical protein
VSPPLCADCPSVDAAWYADKPPAASSSARKEVARVVSLLASAAERRFWRVWYCRMVVRVWREDLGWADEGVDVEVEGVEAGWGRGRGRVWDRSLGRFLEGLGMVVFVVLGCGGDD